MIPDIPELIADVPRYMNNVKLKAAGVSMPMTREQLEEMARIVADPIYFIERYCQIVSIDHGLIKFKLYDYQKRLINLIHNNRQVIAKFPRQSGKTTTNAAYLLWYIIVNEVKTIGVLAHKASGAREVLERTKQMYEALPLWIQQGVRTWNKGSIELGNGCKVVAAATTSSAIRGLTINFLLLDEFAFIPTNNADEFFDSVYPTISSGTSSKISIFSTPKGMNHFWRMWTEATTGRMQGNKLVKSEFVPIEIAWNDIPGRDEAFMQKTINTIGIDSWNQEFATEFLGSVGSLINSQAIRNIVTATPLYEHDHMKVYEEAKKDRIYMATVDVARGAGGDYSVIVMTDITTLPYKQVAVYRNNELNYLLFPGVIYEMAKKYNDAYVLIELNDNGEAVADDLFHSYEYDNILTTGGNKGKVVLGSWVNSKNGVRTTKQTKRLGCSLIKALIENQEYIVYDYDTVQEMSNFVAKAGSYEADAGAHDDIMMCLVIFAWASNQAFFAELCDSNFKKKYIEDSHEKMMQELSPIGYWDGMDDDDDVWNL